MVVIIRISICKSDDNYVSALKHFMLVKLYCFKTVSKRNFKISFISTKEIVRTKDYFYFHQNNF